MERWVRHLVEDLTLAPATVCRRLATLQSFYLEAVDQGAIHRVPTVRVRRPAAARPSGSAAPTGTPPTPSPHLPSPRLRAWSDSAGITTGALFRGVDRHDELASGRRLTDGSVARIVQRAARRTGLDPTRYAGHSLRAGLATTAAAGGAPERAIMRQGRWSSVTVARRYIRSGSLFQENAAAYCGL